MHRRLHAAGIAAAMALAAAGASSAWAPKSGGLLKIYHRDSPASMSIHEEATWSTIMPVGAVFNGDLLAAIRQERHPDVQQCL